MMRKFTHYILLIALWFSVGGCEEEEAATPPTPTFNVNKNSAAVDEELTFTINQVNADAVALLPYGLPGDDPGVPVTFTDGAATVTFSYKRPGTFDAIVVANNHTGDGESVRNVQSTPVRITITSSDNSIIDFSFIRIEEKETAFEVVTVSSDTDIDEDAKTITVTVPYGTDVTNLTAAFTASAFTTVSVGSTVQTTEETVNNFSSPLVYTVTADDGTSSQYTVTVNVTPVETVTTIKSIAATGAEDKALAVDINNVDRVIVVYDTLGTPAEEYEAVTLAYELDGEFASMSYDDKPLEQDSEFDLTSAEEVKVKAQDGTEVTYTVYAATAPKLALSFAGLNPDPAVDVKPENFTIAVSALKGTDVSDIVTTWSTTEPAGVTVTGVTVDDVPVVSGTTPVDYSEPVEMHITVNDSNIGVTYTVVYTVTVTVVP